MGALLSLASMDVHVPSSWISICFPPLSYTISADAINDRTKAGITNSFFTPLSLSIPNYFMQPVCGDTPMTLRVLLRLLQLLFQTIRLIQPIQGFSGAVYSPAVSKTAKAQIREKQKRRWYKENCNQHLFPPQIPKGPAIVKAHPPHGVRLPAIL